MVRDVDFRAIVIQGLPIMIFCALIELAAGNILGGMRERLAVISGLIVMIPPLLDLRGNINGALASRLGTALHTGVIAPKISMTAEVKVNVTSSLILSFLASATIGIMSFGISLILGLEPVGILTLVTIAVVAGMVSGVVLAAMTVIVSVFSYVRGLDPDNITAPIMATVGDLITMLCLLFTAMLVG